MAGEGPAATPGTVCDPNEALGHKTPESVAEMAPPVAPSVQILTRPPGIWPTAPGFQGRLAQAPRHKPRMNSVSFRPHDSMPLVYAISEGREYPLAYAAAAPADYTAQFYGSCYHCGHANHSQNYCPLKHCRRCDKYGHGDKVCFLNRKKYGTFPSGTASKALVRVADAAGVPEPGSAAPAP